MSAKSPVVLSFHDSLIRESDLELLKEGYWLNDTLIGFAFEYFEKEKYKDCADDVCFISPDVTQFIKFAGDQEAQVCLEPLIKNLPSKRLIFLAVNDNSSMEEAGGSHWSLLVYKSSQKSFVHLDSSGNVNIYAAEQISKKVRPFLEGGSEASFETVPCPQQTNASDCGVYVISFVEFICDEVLRNCNLEMASSVTPESVRLKRKQLRELILELSKTGNST